MNALLFLSKAEYRQLEEKGYISHPQQVSEELLRLAGPQEVETFS